MNLHLNLYKFAIRRFFEFDNLNIYDCLMQVNVNGNVNIGNGNSCVLNGALKTSWHWG